MLKPNVLPTELLKSAMFVLFMFVILLAFVCRFAAGLRVYEDPNVLHVGWPGVHMAK